VKNGISKALPFNQYEIEQVKIIAAAYWTNHQSVYEPNLLHMLYLLSLSAL